MTEQEIVTAEELHRYRNDVVFHDLVMRFRGYVDGGLGKFEDIIAAANFGRKIHFANENCDYEAVIRSLPVPSEPSGEESESMKRLRAVAGDKVADACKRGMDKAMEEIRAEERASEKDRRIYYQDIVYSVCNLLDTVYTPSTCCGICTAPTTQVQDRVKSLIEYRDQQSEKYQSQIATLRTALRELAEVAKETSLDLSSMMDDASVGLASFTAPRGYLGDFESDIGKLGEVLAKHRELIDAGAPKKENP